MRRFGNGLRLSALMFVLGGAACQNDDGPDGGGPTDPTNPTDPTRPLVGERFEITLDPSLGRRMTWPSATAPLAGRVLDLDGVGQPGQLDWEVVPAGGNSSVGVGSIDVAGRWTADVPLAPGDNAATVSIPGTPATADLQITYNDGYTFGGPLTLTNTVAYVGETRTLEAEIALTDQDTDPVGATVVQVDATGLETEVGVLVDNGDVAQGDDVGGDLVFHGAFDVLGATVGETLRFRVVVARPSGGQARSELRDVRIHAHLDPTVLDAQIAAGVAFQERMLAAPENERSSVLQDIHDELAQDPDVVVAEFNDSGRGVWFVYSNGVAGVVDIPREGEKSGPGVSVADGGWRSAPLDEVSGSRVKMIAAQYWDWGENDDVPQIEDKLAAQGCVGTPETSFQTVEGGGSLEQFKNLGNYGLVFISTHGDSFFDVPGDYFDQFGWNGPFGQVVLHTNREAVGGTVSLNYEDDFEAGRVVLWYGSYGITPDFVRTYAGRKMLNSLVYVSACRGTWNGSMASAFLEAGAGAYLGYSDYVDVEFTIDAGVPFVEGMLVPGTTVGDAFVPGQVETDADPAEFEMFGSTDLELTLQGIQDGDFESGNLQAAWGGGPGASAVSSFYGLTPTEGRSMAMVTTGLGDTPPAILQQYFCLGPNDHTLVFDWNLLTDKFQGDGDTVSLLFNSETSTAPYYVHDTLLFFETQEMGDDELTDVSGIVLTPDACFEDPCVRMTGWNTMTFPLDSLSYDTYSKITVSALGGLGSNSVLLLDDIHFVP